MPASAGFDVLINEGRIYKPDGSRYILTEERKAGRSFGMQFHVVFDEPYERMVKRMRTDSARRVFMVLPRYLTFTEFRPLRQNDLVADLGISSGSASRALNELAELGAIERKGTGPTTQWRLSMEWGWKGSAASYHKEKRARAEAAKKPAQPRLKVISDTPVA